MNKVKIRLRVAFAIMLIASGFVHFFKAEVYLPMVPQPLPASFIVYAFGIIEILVGIGVCFKRFQKSSTVLILALMILFLPVHAIDLFREHPAIGSHQLAVIRIPLQFVLIAWAWFIIPRSTPINN